jgi:hypothetical protein
LFTLWFFKRSSVIAIFLIILLGLPFQEKRFLNSFSLPPINSFTAWSIYHLWEDGSLPNIPLYEEKTGDLDSRNLRIMRHDGWLYQNLARPIFTIGVLILQEQ